MLVLKALRNDDRLQRKNRVWSCAAVRRLNCCASEWVYAAFGRRMIKDSTVVPVSDRAVALVL